MRVCGARSADTAGRRECVEERIRRKYPAGSETADGQGNVEGQPLGMPGIWQGASSEQGAFSEDASDRTSEAPISGITSGPDPCIIIAPPAPGIANARPPTTIRWRAKRLARSAAYGRKRTMAVNLLTIRGTVKAASVDSE